MLASLLIFKKTAQSKQSPERRKFAQSGQPGANPTIVSYNTCVLKIYNVTRSLVRLKTKKYFLLRENDLAYYSAGVEVVNS
jgi:hypothetical protein